MFRNKEKVYYIPLTSKTIGFCENCLSHRVSTFSQGEFVLIELPSRAPFYGRILETFSTDDGSLATIERGLNEKEPVNLRYITKLGD